MWALTLTVAWYKASSVQVETSKLNIQEQDWIGHEQKHFFHQFFMGITVWIFCGIFKVPECKCLFVERGNCSINYFFVLFCFLNMSNNYACHTNLLHRKIMLRSHCGMFSESWIRQKLTSVNSLCKVAQIWYYESLKILRFHKLMHALGQI